MFTKALDKLPHSPEDAAPRTMSSHGVFLPEYGVFLSVLPGAFPLTSAFSFYFMNFPSCCSSSVVHAAHSSWLQDRKPRDSTSRFWLNASETPQITGVDCPPFLSLKVGHTLPLQNTPSTCSRKGKAQLIPGDRRSTPR